MIHPTEKLSDYVDEELTTAEREDVEAHLAACADCRLTLDDLRAVVDRAATLRDVTPGVDLWAGIEAQLEPPQRGVIHRLSAGASAKAGITAKRLSSWQVTLSLPQLAAAAVLLVAVSAGSMWMLQPRPAPVPPAAPGAVADTEPARAARIVPASADLADASYDSAVADLQRVLKEGRSQLDPATVEVLERNLAIIDQAIRDAHAALAQDPSDLYLSGHLVAARQRKLALLRQASALVIFEREGI